MVEDAVVVQSTEKKENQEIENTGREGWSEKDVFDEASNLPSDELQRQMRRGDETKGDADKRDIAGSVESIETPQGREEAKHERSGSETKKTRN